MLRRGFTLIELLVVITILAILAGAALPYVQNYVAESRIAKAKTDLEEIARALAVYETREGDYTKNNVSDLTGRYLNKAPIDPWGKPYEVATSSGLVLSAGPDRLASTTEDNIQVPYQPPLALVAAKWVDRNQSGAVDLQNVNDQLQLFFSRKLMKVGATGAPTDIASYTSNTHMDNLLKVSTGKDMNFDGTDGHFFVASTTLLENQKVLIFYLATTTAAFVPGSDSIELNSTPDNYFYDIAKNRCISSQSVLILPQ